MLSSVIILFIYRGLMLSKCNHSIYIQRFDVIKCNHSIYIQRFDVI